MSKQQNTKTAPATTDSKIPTHVLYHVEDRGEEKSFWSEIAVGWINKDGSVNLRTNVGAILIPGQSYQLRTRPEKKDAA